MNLFTFKNNLKILIYFSSLLIIVVLGIVVSYSFNKDSKVNFLDINPIILKINKVDNYVADSFYFSEGQCSKDESLIFKAVDGVFDNKLNSIFAICDYKKIKYFKNNNKKIIDSSIYLFKLGTNDFSNLRYLKIPSSTIDKNSSIMQDENNLYILGTKINKKDSNQTIPLNLFVAKINKKNFEFDKNFGNNGVSIIKSESFSSFSQLNGNLILNNSKESVFFITFEPVFHFIELNKLNGNLINSIKNNPNKDNFYFEKYNLFLDKNSNLIIVGAIKNSNNQNIQNGQFFIAKMDFNNGKLIETFILNSVDSENNRFNFVKSCLFGNKTYIAFNNNSKNKSSPSLIVFDLDTHNTNCYIFKDNNLNFLINDIKYYDDYLFLSGGVLNYGYIKFNINNPNDSSYFVYDYNDDPVIVYGSIFDGKHLFLLGGKVNNKAGQISDAIIYKIKNP
ncbi:MAG: hypothetical protein ACP5RD_00105 [bacterium]